MGFTHFSDEVSNLLNTAQKEAMDLGLEYIEPSLILKHLLKADNTIEDKHLQILGLSLVRSSDSETDKDMALTKPKLAYSVNSKKVIELSMREAVKANSKTVEPYHLLLALAHEKRERVIK